VTDIEITLMDDDIYCDLERLIRNWLVNTMRWPYVGLILSHNISSCYFDYSDIRTTRHVLVRDLHVFFIKCGIDNYFTIETVEFPECKGWITIKDQYKGKEEELRTIIQMKTGLKRYE